MSGYPVFCTFVNCSWYLSFLILGQLKFGVFLMHENLDPVEINEELNSYNALLQ